MVQVQRGRHDDGADCIRRALALRPGWAEAHYNLGWAYREQWKTAEAAACLRRAIELKPDYLEAHDALASVYQEQEKLDQAVALHRRTIELNPNYAAAYNNLGVTLAAQGRVDEGAAACRRALEMRPDWVSGHGSLLWMLQYRNGVTLSELAAAHAEYDRRHARPLRAAWLPHEKRPRTPAAASRRVRLVRFRPAPGRVFLGPVPGAPRPRPVHGGRLLRSHRPGRSDRATPRRRGPLARHDRTGSRQLAEQIRSDRINVLFDLAGHTGGTRLMVFARKPAPVQITWLGYEGTTGLEAMDYILADRWTIPVDSESFYRERVLRMPDGYVCYDPPSAAPSRDRCPPSRAASFASAASTTWPSSARGRSRSGRSCCVACRNPG